MAAYQSADRWLLSPDGLGRLLADLRTRGYRLVGPTVLHGAVVHLPISGLSELPAGWREDQEAGTYRLKKTPSECLFGYSVGPHSWKHLLFVPRLRLWKAHRRVCEFTIVRELSAPAPLALVGARACDLHAIEIQDRVFLQGPFVDPDYATRRHGLFVLAVHCTQAGGTCFCSSMGTGPRASFGFDLALTELQGPLRFVVEAGSILGKEITSNMNLLLAPSDDVQESHRIVDNVGRSMRRQIDTTDIRELLFRNTEHPRWDEVARRCLGCTNCTLVCPTCFCARVQDSGDPAGEFAERWRLWDSCFALDHSFLHGGSVRSSTRSRYRQWITHKLASWIDQFGVSGCVGCGRCITWCPMGIDITQEVEAIRAADGAKSRGEGE